MDWTAVGGDVVLLLPLVALLIGTALQASESADEWKSSVPSNELYLADRQSAQDVLLNVKVLLGMFDSIPERRGFPGGRKALRVWQGWMWLLLSAILGVTLQLIKVIYEVPFALVLGLVLFVAWPAAVVVRSRRISRSPDLLPYGQSDSKAKRRRTRFYWTVFPFLPLVEMGLVEGIRARIWDFYAAARELEWPYWVKTPRLVLEPGDAKRVMIAIEPSQAWSEDFRIAVGGLLQYIGLRPADGSRYSAVPQAVPADTEPPEWPLLPEVCWYTRIESPEVLHRWLQTVDTELRQLDVPPGPSKGSSPRRRRSWKRT